MILDEIKKKSLTGTIIALSPSTYSHRNFVNIEDLEQLRPYIELAKLFVEKTEITEHYWSFNCDSLELNSKIHKLFLQIKSLENK